MDKIDSLDLKILKVLTADARVPLKELADTCGMSRAAVHQRIMRLMEAGTITGSGYHLNPKSIGYNTCTYVGITLERGSMYRAVAARLEQIPEIVECHFTTGAYTMLVKLYSHDNAHLMELLNEGIQGIEGVTSTETLISLEQTIHREIPIVALPATSEKPRQEKRGRKPKKTKTAP